MTHPEDTIDRWRALGLMSALDRALIAIGDDDETRAILHQILATQLDRVVTGQCTREDAHEAIKGMLLDD